MGFTLDSHLKALVDQEVGKVLPEVIKFRHERHQHPELTWQEIDTAKAVAQALRQHANLEPTEGVGRHGVVAIIEGAHPGPTIGLRADMDALPVREATGKAYASCKDGVMHACGHDGHMANLLGSAMVLSRLRDRLHGRVKLIFQPAEEGGAGAEVMCQDGVLTNPDVDVIFGLHGWSEIPCGHLYFKTGAMLASTSDFTIKVEGTGCHAALPHLGTDQVLIAARIIESLQSIRSRFTAPAEPLALSVTMIHGGTANNIIPASLTLGGTLRTVNDQVRDQCVRAMHKLVSGVAEAHGARAILEIEHNYPTTMNHPGPTEFLESVAKQLFPQDHVKKMPVPSMGGEDFAYFLKRIPGSYFFLGVDDGRAGGYPSLHHPGYDFNDQALPVGIKMFVHAALAYGATHK
jgi:amidohydrolase